MKEFKTKEEVLQDAIDYYWGKPERRCYKAGACRYTPTETSEGCAIGRLVDIEIAESLADTNHTIKNSDIAFEKLPTWLKDMGRGFLVSLQFTHDTGWLADKKVDDVIEKMSSYVDMTKITFPE